MLVIQHLHIYAGQLANIAVDKLTGIDLLGDVVGGVVQKSLSQ